MENIVGANIATNRKNMNMTQSQLAEKLNVSRSVVSKWENGKIIPGSYWLPLLAKALNVTINDLFNHIDEKKDYVEEDFVKEHNDKLANKYKLFMIMSTITLFTPASAFLGTLLEYSSLFWVLLFVSCLVVLVSFGLVIYNSVRLFDKVVNVFDNSKYMYVLKNYLGTYFLIIYLILFVLIDYLMFKEAIHHIILYLIFIIPLIIILIKLPLKLLMPQTLVMIIVSSFCFISASILIPALDALPFAFLFAGSQIINYSMLFLHHKYNKKET